MSVFLGNKCRVGISEVLNDINNIVRNHFANINKASTSCVINFDQRKYFVNDYKKKYFTLYIILRSTAISSDAFEFVNKRLSILRLSYVSFTPFSIICHFLEVLES